jgi:hypothetical protein
VHWAFGDGAQADSGYLFKGARGSYGLPDGESRVRHAFAPGRYAVTVRATDEAGGTPAWTLPVVVHPALRATLRASRLGRGRVRLAAGLRGGSGKLVRVLWTLDGGRKQEGFEVTVKGGRVTAEVTDSSATVARISAEVHAGQVTRRHTTPCQSR